MFTLPFISKSTHNDILKTQTISDRIDLAMRCMVANAEREIKQNSSVITNLPSIPCLAYAVTREGVIIGRLKSSTIEPGAKLYVENISLTKDIDFSNLSEVKDAVGAFIKDGYSAEAIDSVKWHYKIENIYTNETHVLTEGVKLLTIPAFNMLFALSEEELQVIHHDTADTSTLKWHKGKKEDVISWLEDKGLMKELTDQTRFFYKNTTRLHDSKIDERLKIALFDIDDPTDKALYAHIYNERDFAFLVKQKTALTKRHPNKQLVIDFV